MCLIEKIRRQHYLDGYLRDLSFDPEAQAPEYFRKVAALAAEARIYWERAVAYQAVMFGEEAPEPNRRSILRYFLAGALAYKRRRDLVRFLAPYRREERRQRAVAVEAVRDLRARYGQTDPTDQSN